MPVEDLKEPGHASHLLLYMLLQILVLHHPRRHLHPKEKNEHTFSQILTLSLDPNKPLNVPISPSRCVMSLTQLLSCVPLSPSPLTNRTFITSVYQRLPLFWSFKGWADWVETSGKSKLRNYPSIFPKIPKQSAVFCVSKFLAISGPPRTMVGFEIWGLSNLSFCFGRK